MNQDNTQQEPQVEQTYFFPTLGKAVVATSREEAEKLVQPKVDQVQSKE